jgi:hypothetical protein
LSGLRRMPESESDSLDSALGGVDRSWSCADSEWVTGSEGRLSGG